MKQGMIQILDNLEFGFRRATLPIPEKIITEAHVHHFKYEIIFLLSGDLEFDVEGSLYKLNPFDLVIARPNESHKMLSNSAVPYERITIHLTDEFSKKNNCEDFFTIFNNRRLGSHNVISSDIVKEHLANLLFKIEKYINDGAYTVANCVLVELLYILNDSKTTPPNIKNKNISDILNYINENLTQDLSLDFLSEKFFINKYYLCKLFKKCTGYTVITYINYKRILLAQELHKNGQTLMEACINSGFDSYSNFYRIYVKQIGTSPKNMFKNNIID